MLILDLKNKCDLATIGKMKPALEKDCWFKTKNITMYWKQNYSRLNHQIKRHPLCIPIAVPILLFHLIKTPWSRSLCACVYICIYTYRLCMYCKICYGGIEYLLLISFQLGQCTWHDRVRRLICWSDDGLVMVWSRALPVLECRTWV